VRRSLSSRSTILRHPLATAAVLAALLLPGPAAARRAASPCPDGTYAVRGAPFSDAQGAPIAARVTLVGSEASIAGICPTPTAARRQVRRRLTTVKAKWASCPGLPGPVALAARIRAPSCAKLAGTLVAREARPKRRRLAADRLAPAGIVAVLADLETQGRMFNENSVFLLRGAAEPYNPELVALIAAGPAAVDGILEAFGGTAGLADDIPLSLLAYALEHIGDRRAIPVLSAWLERNLFASLLWAPDFVTHTIKVLGDLGGLDTESYTYGIDDKLDTIAQARTLATAATARSRPAPAVDVLSEERNKCDKKLRVVGITANGTQEEVTLDYGTLFYDIQEQIDLQTDQTKKDRLRKLYEKYQRDDDAFYGPSDYRPIGDVSVASNCGGSVTERLLNGVAEAKGLPLRLGAGNVPADKIRDLALKFGSEVAATQLDTFTVIAHQWPAGKSAHVEIPVSDNGGSAVVYSKDNQGRPRLHTVDKGQLVNAFGPVQQRYNFRPFYDFDQTTPHFYRLDPNRIVSITIDSSGCPCDFAFGGVIPVAFTQPSEPTTADRVLTVAGTVGDPDVAGGTLRVNGSPQAVTVGGGGFSSIVVLRSGDNTLRMVVDGADGRRGCTERAIRSTTPRTTISATLTWNLHDADVDLYVTQPDNQTAWYLSRTTTIGGRLDVDNTSGIGPENYFLSFEEGDTVLPGTYTVRVHYYSDHLATGDTPTRVVDWRVAIVVNEGTPQEKREFPRGTLAVDNSGNASPGASGGDWATAFEIVIPQP
jgi:uncharacterized protein YfaP (DUF2135 family)